MKQAHLTGVLQTATATYKQFTIFVALLKDGTIWKKWSDNAGGNIARPNEWTKVEHQIPFPKTVSVSLWDEIYTITVSCANSSAIWTKTSNSYEKGWVNINQEPQPAKG